MENSVKQPLVSIIIPTYNSEKFLEKCLISIKRQKYDKIEIIIVDDGSTDSTINIAKKYGCNVINNPKRGRAEAKNEGIKHSKGEYLLFIDSDMELTPSIINECIGIAEKVPNIGGIIISEHSVGKSFWVKVRNFEKSFYTGLVVESARFFCAKLVKEVGGFEEGLVFFEESTLPYKIQKKGLKIFLRTKNQILHHEENFELKTWLRKKFYYGKTMSIYKRKCPEFSIMQTSLGFRSSLFLKNWKKLFKSPPLMVGIILLKSLEYFIMNLADFSSKVWQS
ncbi:MAG: glycosyltransferase [Nitrososphaeria archaeon]